MQPKILYIEDQLINLRLMKKLLKRTNYQLIEAMDGLTGLEIALEAMPDLIITDIHLPDINGYEVIRGLKQSPETFHIPVLALTADTLQQTKMACIEAGADGYITKPITNTQLVRTLEDFLAVATPR